MTAADQSRALPDLLEGLRKQYPQAYPGPPECAPIDAAEPLLGQFLRSFLVWESTTAKAVGALRRIEQAVVDFNELRVCLPDELVRLMGERYPGAQERAVRLSAALRDLYRREHAVTLERLIALGKREARQYLDSLDGVPPFVSARVVLLNLDGHAAPVDQRILHVLCAAGIVEEKYGADDAAGLLERRVRAGELAEAYHRLQAAADDGPGPEGARAAPRAAHRPKSGVARKKTDAKAPTAPKRSPPRKPADD